ncbi:MAG: cardiolipin synthase [Ruminococcus sp.]|nr:cardiolipin synthase [Ruminococcus sp.]
MKKSTFWKKLARILFSQKTTIIILLLLQIFFIMSMILGALDYSQFTYYLLSALGLALAAYICNQDVNPGYKLAWVIPLLAIPLFSTVAYFILSNQYSTKAVRKKHIENCKKTAPYLRQDPRVLSDLIIENSSVSKLSEYLDKYAGYPTCRGSSIEYFSCGMDKFRAMVRELKKARRFIFMEYFIIGQGEMWSEIRDILIEKAAQGVDVRLMYDGMGSLDLLPFRYDKKLREAGIKCHVFNPFRPLLSTIQNNRDHRKICVIDGNVAFTGGVNIADEYIGRLDRFGVWKDSAVMIRGSAVWNFTVMFLQMWEIVDSEPNDYNSLRPSLTLPEEETRGFVIPYGDSPLDRENVGEMVYLDMINHARKYVYITTPYLIPNNELVTALEYAAKSGLDVRIITPGHPDKWYCRSIAWSYYRDLLELGVRIYEFDGFIHAKNCVTDDKCAVVGTINLDYRSLYLHFECAAFMYGTGTELQIRQDFEDTLRHSREITVADCDKRSMFSCAVSAVLRMFAPLL